MGKANQVGTVNLSNQLPHTTAYSPDLQWQLPCKQKLQPIRFELQTSGLSAVNKSKRMWYGREICSAYTV